MLVFRGWARRRTLITRHASAGWDRGRRHFENVDGLGPSLRWDDGLLRIPQLNSTSVACLISAGGRTSE